MSYTAQEIHEISVAIIDEVSANGTIDATKTKEYASRAPFLLDAWSQEWARIEHIANVVKITSLSQTLQISDANCISGAYYLARFYANADQNSELAAICSSKYEDLKRQARIPIAPLDITDIYSFSTTENY